MKKLYLLLLVFLLLFIPATNAVTPYQLDHPIRELNGYTLREVFEDNNQIIYENWTIYNLDVTLILENDEIKIQFNNTGLYFSVIENEIINYVQGNLIYVRYDLQLNYDEPFQRVAFQSSDTNIFIPVLSGYNIVSFIREIDDISTTQFRFGGLRNTSDNLSYAIYSDVYAIDLNSLGIHHLTVEQMDMYYDYYLKAVQFEIDYYEAGQDPGEYQLIFKSIINGVKNLISEMAGVWEFLNAPIVSTNPDDFGFNIDWSWDLIGVIKQIFNNLAIIILQVSFLIPTAIFNIFNIPVRISLLSLLFTNFVFVLLGWIVVKSFII